MTVLVACATHSGATRTLAVTWTKTHYNELRRRPFAFFSCSGSASDPTKGGKQKATDAFLERFPLASLLRD